MKQWKTTSKRERQYLNAIRLKKLQERKKLDVPQFPMVLVGVPIDADEPIVVQGFRNIYDLTEVSGLKGEKSVERHFSAILKTAGKFQWSRSAHYRHLCYNEEKDWIVLRDIYDWPEYRRLEAQRAVRMEARRFIGILRFDLSVR